MMHGSFLIPDFLFYFSLLKCAARFFAHLLLTIIPLTSPFSILVRLTALSPSLTVAGRLKFIALASAVGVSAGLITLTVAVMIR